MEPAPINRLLALSQLHLEQFQEAQTLRAPLSKLDTIVSHLAKDLQSLKEAGEQQTVDEAMLDKISNTLQSLQAGKTPERTGNAANILQALQEKVEEIRKKREEVRYKKGEHKVTRLELVQFLNSTEKQFARMITLIRERNADDEQLLAFIEELKKQIEEMKLARSLNLRTKRVVPADKKESIQALIDEILRVEHLLPSEQRELFIKTVKLFRKELFGLFI